MFAILFAGLTAFAASDSLAVFQNTEKVIVQINERGRGTRVEKFVKAWSKQDDLLWESPTQDVRINCGLYNPGATCMIRLVPSAHVIVEGKVTTTRFEFKGPDAPQDTEVSFESSRGQKFQMSVSGGILKIVADSSRTAH